MSIHYLNPRDEPRDCPACLEGRAFGFSQLTRYKCKLCEGTGRLGNPDGARVLISGIPRAHYWSTTSVKHGQGPYPTESAALAAAREALTKRS